MRFQVAFNNRCNVEIRINDDCITTSFIGVPIQDFISMLYDIYYDFDLVKPELQEEIKAVIQQFQEVI